MGKNQGSWEAGKAHESVENHQLHDATVPSWYSVVLRNKSSEKRGNGEARGGPVGEEPLQPSSISCFSPQVDGCTHAPLPVFRLRTSQHVRPSAASANLRRQCGRSGVGRGLEQPRRWRPVALLCTSITKNPKSYFCTPIGYSNCWLIG